MSALVRLGTTRRSPPQAQRRPRITSLTSSTLSNMHSCSFCSKSSRQRVSPCLCRQPKSRQVKKFLQKYEALFPEKAQEVLNQVRLGGSDRDYVGSVKEYALAAHNLVTPVNIWRIPYPRGHAAVFASPTKLSLVASNHEQGSPLHGGATSS